MKKLDCFISIFFLFILIPFVGVGQELCVITEDFKIPKDSCKIYAYELETYLKSKGLYEGLATPKDKKGDINLVKKKLQIKGNDFTEDHTFIVEYKWAYDTSEDEYFGDFLIIEVGFESKAKATKIFDRAKAISKIYAMNIPVYWVLFKCVQVENSVLFVCSLNLDLHKYRDMMEDWQPGKK